MSFDALQADWTLKESQITLLLKMRRRRNQQKEVKADEASVGSALL
jgi:hypothetical protein